MLIEFLKNNLDANALSLVSYFNLKEEQYVPIVSFEIVVRGTFTGLVLIDNNKYKSALLLLYLAQLSFKKYNPVSAGFHMNPKYQQIVITYFGNDLCDDVRNNPETKHTTIRNLLEDGPVIIYINCK